jgi:hypothetical protein
MSDLTSAVVRTNLARRSLDDGLYALDDEEKLFLKELTHIEDDEKLKQHILTVQKNAWAVRATSGISFQDWLTFCSDFSLCVYPCLQLHEVPVIIL